MKWHEEELPLTEEQEADKSAALVGRVWRGARKRANAIGEKFGFLTIIGSSDKRAGGHVYWLCRCECGNEKEIHGLHLRRGKVTSCGCKVGTFHGLSKTPEYRIWANMKRRCHNPKYRQFHYYGGRGIAVCDEWRASFLAFLSDMGHRPSPELTIERIDNELGYSKGNCKWATQAEQNLNKRPRHDGRKA